MHEKYNYVDFLKTEIFEKWPYFVSLKYRHPSPVPEFFYGSDFQVLTFKSDKKLLLVSDVSSLEKLYFRRSWGGRGIIGWFPKSLSLKPDVHSNTKNRPSTGFTVIRSFQKKFHPVIFSNTSTPSNIHAQNIRKMCSFCVSYLLQESLCLKLNTFGTQ